jgi:hypothetical protein
MINPTADLPGDSCARPPELPDFDLIRLIGEGGFGQVWLARNRTTGHLRAVKVIPLHGIEAMRRAGREVASLSRLQSRIRREHPHLLTVHHVGRTRECVFYVMDPADDLVGGPASAAESYRPATLENKLAEGLLAPEQCLDYARQLLSGLGWLHAAGVVHRDVKPANCLLVEGELKLADFGLVTEIGPQVSRVGTEKYMPPDGRMDGRADVYAAGLVIYEMVTGLPVERFPQLGERDRQIAGDPTLCRLMRLVLRACQPDRAARFADAPAMAAALDRAEPDGDAVPAASRRKWLAVAAAVAVAAGLGGVGAWLAWPWNAAERTHVNFVTDPFEATVFLDGRQQISAEGEPYRTPCTIDDLPARRCHVIFKLEGRPDLDAGKVDFARVRQVSARWDDPAAASPGAPR